MQESRKPLVGVDARVSVAVRTRPPAPAPHPPKTRDPPARTCQGWGQSRRLGRVPEGGVERGLPVGECPVLLEDPMPPSHTSASARGGERRAASELADCAPVKNYSLVASLVYGRISAPGRHRLDPPARFETSETNLHPDNHAIRLRVISLQLLHEDPWFAIEARSRKLCHQHRGALCVGAHPQVSDIRRGYRRS
jgi:hypothetical protein